MSPWRALAGPVLNTADVGARRVAGTAQPVGAVAPVSTVVRTTFVIVPVCDVEDLPGGRDGLHADRVGGRVPDEATPGRSCDPENGYPPKPADRPSFVSVAAREHARRSTDASCRC